MARFINENDSLFIIAVPIYDSNQVQLEFNRNSCKLFELITLPSLKYAILQKPPNSHVLILLVNDSIINEPICSQVISNTMNLLKGNVLISSKNEIFEYYKYTKQKDFRYVFFSRLQAGDAFSHLLLRDMKYFFMQTALPLAVLSPLFVTLWYPNATPLEPCGELLFNRMWRFEVQFAILISKSE